MRLYKAFLNENYDVLDFEEPSDLETIFSRNERKEFEIDKKTLTEYIELSGYITAYRYNNKMDEYVMYLDIDHKFHTLWDNDTSIHVMDQIKRTMREELWEAVKNKDHDRVHDFIKIFPTIVGLKELEVGAITYVYHKYIGGMWDSSDPNVITVDRVAGTVKALKVGESTIKYVVDTGAGITTCFHKIKVIAK